MFKYFRRCFLVVFSAIVAWVSLVIEAELEGSDWYEHHYEQWFDWYYSDFFDSINGKWGIE